MNARKLVEFNYLLLIAFHDFPQMTFCSSDEGIICDFVFD